MALLLSALAFTMSGFVLFQSFDNGRLIKNSRELIDELKKGIESRKQNKAERSAARLADDEATRGGIEWSRIRERLDRIGAMVRDRDNRAGYYIDVLETDLQNLRDFTSKHASKALDKTVQELGEVKAKLADDKDAAYLRLRELSRDAASRVESKANQYGSELEAGIKRRADKSDEDLKDSGR